MALGLLQKMVSNQYLENKWTDFDQTLYNYLYDQLRAVTAMIPASEFLIPCGDWNGHVGSTGSGYKEVHGGYGP